jgi:putative zinc finger/helix-turn-helix YgiT family protein
MTRCAFCKSTSFETVHLPEVLAVGGRSFTADLPYRRCSACREEIVDDHVVVAFEKAVAAALLEQQPSGEGFRFLRKRLALSGKDVAELLDVTVETISQWENNRRPIPRQSWALLGVLVHEHIRGDEVTMARLRAPVRAPAPKTHVQLAV